MRPASEPFYGLVAQCRAECCYQGQPETSKQYPATPHSLAPAPLVLKPGPKPEGAQVTRTEAGQRGPCSQKGLWPGMGCVCGWVCACAHTHITKAQLRSITSREHHGTVATAPRLSLVQLRGEVLSPRRARWPLEAHWHSFTPGG